MTDTPPTSLADAIDLLRRQLRQLETERQKVSGALEVLTELHAGTYSYKVTAVFGDGSEGPLPPAADLDPHRTEELAEDVQKRLDKAHTDERGLRAPAENTKGPDPTDAPPELRSKHYQPNKPGAPPQYSREELFEKVKAMEPVGLAALEVALGWPRTAVRGNLSRLREQGRVSCSGRSKGARWSTTSVTNAGSASLSSVGKQNAPPPTRF